MVLKKREKNKKFRDLPNVDYEELKGLYSKLKKYISVIEQAGKSIPVSIFNKKLSPLETICKYLHENLRLSYEEISKLVDRSNKTIWQACNNAKRKYPSYFVVKSFAITIPVLLFKNRKLSIFEHSVVHLKKEYELRFSEIALMLKRDQRTIWTVYYRAQKKLKNG